MSDRDPIAIRPTLRERRAAPTPADAVDLRLVAIVESAAASHPLARGPHLIGRAEESDIQIEASGVSRHHARLTVHADGLEIEDCGSSNGTFVAGVRLTPGEPQAFGIGVAVELGNRAVFVVMAADAARSTGDALEPNDPMAALETLARRVAATEISVIITGETGVGKEVLARSIHDWSPRAAGPFVAINCGGFAAALLESEMFGHEKGAFTGALRHKRGLIERANGGTVFFDEVGEMPAALQVKLLRVLEQREVLLVGGTTPHALDIRVLAATNRDLEAEMESARFRSDLFFRLNGISLTIPPLRARPGDREELVLRFTREAAAAFGLAQPPIWSPSAQAWLERHPWPGNIRELKQVVERAVLTCDGGTILPEQLPATRGDATPGAGEASLKNAVKETERRRIIETLERCAGNQTRAAKELGIARGTLLRRMDEYGIPRPRKGRSK